MHQRGWRVWDLGSRSLARLALHKIGALSARLLLAEIEGGRQNAGPSRHCSASSLLYAERPPPPYEQMSHVCPDGNELCVA
jgi:hypothetical protein